MRKRLGWMVPLVGLLLAGAALAQANTGKITGKVTSEGQPLPGVAVTATSPSLQGSRVDFSRETGEFLLVQLPAGDYELVFNLDGFSAVRMPVKVNANQVAEVNQAMAVSGVTEEIVVTGEIDTISTETQSQTTYEQEMIEELAITRSIEDTVVLAPGVHATGPRRQAGINDLAISISGAPSYENLMMVNGVVVNENTRGQAIEFVIEDAVQETTISTSGISAQYGRFNGGVVNVITRSGGNDFHGSVRVNVDKEVWQGENQFTPDSQNNDANETYEGTLGGFLWKDHLWFFLAGRDLERAGSAALQRVQIPIATGTEHDRSEAKLTVSPHPSHRIIGSYMERNTLTLNDNFSNASVDLSSAQPDPRGPRGPHLGQLQRRAHQELLPRGAVVGAQPDRRQGRRRQIEGAARRHLDPRRSRGARVHGRAGVLRSLRRQRAQQREHPG